MTTELTRAIDLKWDHETLGPMLNDTGDEFLIVYDDQAAEQAVYLAIKSSDYTTQLSSAHPSNVPELLNKLTEELEENELLVILGSISLKYDFTSKKLVFSAELDLQTKKTIGLVMDLTAV